MVAGANISITSTTEATGIIFGHDGNDTTDRDDDDLEEDSPEKEEAFLSTQQQQEQKTNSVANIRREMKLNQRLPQSQQGTSQKMHVKQQHPHHLQPEQEALQVKGLGADDVEQCKESRSANRSLPVARRQILGDAEGDVGTSNRMHTYTATPNTVSSSRRTNCRRRSSNGSSYDHNRHPSIESSCSSLVTTTTQQPGRRRSVDHQNNSLKNHNSNSNDGAHACEKDKPFRRGSAGTGRNGMRRANSRRGLLLRSSSIRNALDQQTPKAAQQEPHHHTLQRRNSSHPLESNNNSSATLVEPLHGHRRSSLDSTKFQW